MGSPDKPGTICIETSYDWLTGPTCTDYVYEIEYPTGAFIYTNLGDFALYNQNNQITKLRCTPSIFPDTEIFSCLEGLIQIPNTTFTFRIVNQNDPNDIIATKTFQLETSNVIGTTGQQTLLSNAIANGDLLQPNQAAIQGQNIVINGELIVDKDYSFNTSINGGNKNSITMGPNAKITVLPGISLGIIYADIFACEEKWDRFLHEAN
jgi:hypothetical protein